MRTSDNSLNIFSDKISTFSLRKRGNQWFPVKKKPADGLLQACLNPELSSASRNGSLLCFPLCWFLLKPAQTHNFKLSFYQISNIRLKAGCSPMVPVALQRLVATTHLLSNCVSKNAELWSIWLIYAPPESASSE